MASTLPADREPSLADQQAGAPRDILDTADAGPAVIRGSLLRVGAYGIGMIATVLSSAVVIRHLGLVNTGHFTTVTALVTIVITISDLGLSGIAVREYSSAARADGQRYLRNLLGIRLTIALAGVALATLFAVLVGYPSVMVAGTVIAGAGAVLVVAQDGCSIPLQVKLRFAWVAGLQLAIQIGVAIEAVLLALAGTGLLPFFALQLPVVAPALLVTVIVGGHDARLMPQVDMRQWQVMVRRILPYSAGIVLSVLYFQMGQIMVSVISHPTDTGYFGVAFRALLAFTTLPPLLVSTSLPLLARAARDDAQRFAYASRRLAETMLVAGCGVALALFLGAGFAVSVVAGHGYGPSVEVLRILAFALLGTFVIGARGYALLSLDRLRAMLASNAVALVVVVAVGAPLIGVYGADGAAIAMVAAELTLALCYELALSLKRPELRLSPRFAARAALAMALAGAVAIALGISPLASAALGMGLYAVASLALGLVPAEISHAVLPPNCWIRKLVSSEPRSHGR
jgi:O-antigen/teichoic acid export membrane protein